MPVSALIDPAVLDDEQLELHLTRAKTNATRALRELRELWTDLEERQRRWPTIGVPVTLERRIARVTARREDWVARRRELRGELSRRELARITVYRAEVHAVLAGARTPLEVN